MKRIKAGSKAQWVALSLSRHIGAKTLNSLLAHFDNQLDAIFAADEAALLKVPGVGVKIAHDILHIDPTKTARDIPLWERQGIQVLTPGDALYPARLQTMADYPLTLFVRGWQPVLRQRAIAIVGTRRPSQKAKFVTLRLAGKLARAGCTIVSGLALGIDAAAHVGAMQARGTSIAVLGSGVLHVYPPQNRGLASLLRQSGALMSEVHPSLPSNAPRLVSRNRMISAMSRAVIVVESDEDGGAMHTARFASEQGRPIYTFAWPAAGNQKLIRQGAAVIAEDLRLDGYEFG